MQNWREIFPKNSGLSPFVWIILCILPFYFVFKSSSRYEIAAGVFMVAMFFVAYGFSLFVSKGWLVYFLGAIQIAICIIMTVQFGYVYFSLFLAFYIGNIQNRVGFFTIYAIHVAGTVIAVNVGFIVRDEMFFSQFPFIIMTVIGVIFLPLNSYNLNKREELEDQLEDANKRISELGKLEERHRIARDLHDTLGQKLSLIGLKSDLASKLITKNPQSALNEIDDIRQTARTALKEVRELVADMRGTKVEEEILRIKQILKAAQIEYFIYGNATLTNTPLLVENVLSMCLKEAITNVVKHSRATTCHLTIQQLPTGVVLTVKDNGVGSKDKLDISKGNGLRGMRERLEFVNGSLGLSFSNGTKLTIKVPNPTKQFKREELM